MRHAVRLTGAVVPGRDEPVQLAPHHGQLLVGRGRSLRCGLPAGRTTRALALPVPEQVTATDLAGEAITAKLTTAPGNGAALGGLKVTTENAWFAARPSGTEDVYKIYAESFKGPEHLAEVQEAAKEVVNKVIA